jgi:checkpoint serine/threonine-protein kinase
MGIFVDEPGHRGQDDAPGEWGDFGTRDERRKENTVEATPWKGETLPQKGVAPRTPKVEVFRDMVRFICLACATTDTQGDNHEMVRPAEDTLFKPKKLTDAELLKKNPLRYYDNATSASTLPTIPAPPSSRKPPRPKVPVYVAEPWVCPTDDQLIKDSKGKWEKRMLDWSAVHKNGEEWSFEEVRARERGLLGKAWRGAVAEWETSWHLPQCESLFCSVFTLMLTCSIHA